MDNFFKVSNCMRCGTELNGGRIMSMFNTDVICLSCKDEEKRHDNYEEAHKRDNEEIAKGNYNFKGIGLDK